MKNTYNTLIEYPIRSGTSRFKPETPDESLVGVDKVNVLPGSANVEGYVSPHHVQ